MADKDISWRKEIVSGDRSSGTMCQGMDRRETSEDEKIVRCNMEDQYEVFCMWISLIALAIALILPLLDRKEK